MIHNHNIAVVSDTDRIICADIDREASTKLTYVLGSIEDPTINMKVVDVLKGAMPAFNNRKEKYYHPVD